MHYNMQQSPDMDPTAWSGQEYAQDVAFSELSLSSLYLPPGVDVGKFVNVSMIRARKRSVEEPGKLSLVVRMERLS